MDLRGFLGAARFLADDIYKVRVPRRSIVSDHWGYRSISMDGYGDGAPPVWYMSDACISGVAAVVAQGDDWKTAEGVAVVNDVPLANQRRSALRGEL